MIRILTSEFAALWQNSRWADHGQIFPLGQPLGSQKYVLKLETEYNSKIVLNKTASFVPAAAQPGVLVN
jgi:hypothetical protein